MIAGQGIAPSGATATELSAITRRAFMPTLTVQIYNSSPWLASLISNAQVMSGGLDAITVPVQGSRMSTHTWGDYSGSFGIPAQQNGIQNAAFTPKLSMVPIPFLGMEAAIQVDYAVVPRLEAVMNDAGNVAADAMATATYSNISNTQAFTGTAAMIDDGTNAASYGGIVRSSNTFWKSRVYAAAGAVPNRQLMAQYINGVVKACGEKPSYGLMGVGTWTLLQQDFIGQESYNITPGSSFDSDSQGPRSGFTALMVSGVPFYCDPYCPESELRLIQSRYMNLYLHESASFAFSDFVSTQANGQLGFVGVLTTIGELVGVKPSAMARVTGLATAAI